MGRFAGVPLPSSDRQVSRYFDVVVVGGGPAGSSAAISCAEAGLRVALLERERFPRDLPGETLPPGVEPYCIDWACWNRCLRQGFSGTKGIGCAGIATERHRLRIGFRSAKTTRGGHRGAVFRRGGLTLTLCCCNEPVRPVSPCTNRTVPWAC